MEQWPLIAWNTIRSFFVAPAALAAGSLLSLACHGASLGDPKPRASAVTPAAMANRFGMVEASGQRWLHLSSRHGDLPVPSTSRQQTAAVVADLDGDGLNDFVLGFREQGPALVWYRRSRAGWDRYVIEKDYLTIEAGGAVADVDSDGHPDLVFGGDWQSNKVWWWRNPGSEWKPDVPWERHTIKRSGWSESKTDPDNPKAQALIFYGDGKGNFRETVFQTGMGFHEARVADLDGDGRVDILSKPYNWDAPRVDVWLNQGRIP